MKWFFAIFMFLLLCLIAGIGGILWVFWSFGRDLPDYAKLANYEPPVVTRIHAGDGALLAEYATEKRLFMPTKAMPPKLIAAFLSAEDKSYYQHFGVDLKALSRAVITNIANIGSGRRPIGASTITQQVAKNFLLTNEVSIERKIKEAILAIRIEHALDKEDILALYLNDIYLGLSSYGVAAAALNYFDKPLDQLELHEIAYLAALPKAPNNYHPVRRTAAAIARRNWVLQQMFLNGYITEDEKVFAQSFDLGVRTQTGSDLADAPYFTEEVRRELVSLYGSDTLYGGGLSVRTTLVPKLQVMAREALISGLEALDRRQGWRGPVAQIDREANINEQLSKITKYLPAGRFAALILQVKPKEAVIYVNGIKGIIPFTLASWAYPPRDDLGIRPAPIKSLKQALTIGDIIIVQKPENAQDLVSEDYQAGPLDWALGQRPLVEGAIVVMDPHTGRLLAMSGGYNFSDSEFNRATQANRQPGSAFKPFIYLAALDKGYSPTTQILDAPLAIDQGPGLPKWKPSNYTKQFYGPSIMRVGIEKSRNLMTARLAMAIGMPTVQDYAKRFNINSDLPAYLSMALGAGETTLLRITAAYGQLVNGGLKVTPTLIDRVQDRYGKTIMRHDNRKCERCFVNSEWLNQAVPILPEEREQLTDPASAYQIITMLEGVIKRGTGRRLQQTGLVLAGKTGTTNDNTNAWFIGFSPDLVAGVFVGYDNPRPLGKSETGSSAAVPIFQSFMTKALADAPQIPFRRPDGVNLYPVHAEKGYQVKLSDPNVVMEVFKPGQSPLSATLTQSNSANSNLTQSNLANSNSANSDFMDLPQDKISDQTIKTPDLY